MASVQKAAARAGLGAMQWPALGGGTHAAMTAMARDVARADAEIEASSGYAFGGGLLGLRGRVRLALGTNAYGDIADAGFDTDGHTVHIASSPETGWGAVSHEWLHALDAAAGMEQAARERAADSCGFASDRACGRHGEKLDTALRRTQPLAAWADLARSLRDAGTPAKAEFESEVKTALETLEDRWRRQYNTLPARVVQSLHRTALREGSKALAAAAQAAFLSVGVEPVRAASRGIMLAVEWDTLQKAEWRPNQTVWRGYRDAVTQALDRSGKNVLADGYYQQPTEIMAHAFESRVGRTLHGALASDVRPGQQALNYPLPREVDAQGPAWVAFFKAILPAVRQWDDRRQPTKATVRVGGPL